MSEILNKTDMKNWKPEIWYFNVIWTSKIIIKDLKQQKIISIKLYNDLIATLNERFKLKRKNVEPPLYSFLKSAYSLQLEGEVSWFDWKLNKLTQTYIESKNQLLERMSLFTFLYDLLVNIPPVLFYIVIIIIMSSYIWTITTTK